MGVTKQHAKKIVSKLGAEVVKGTKAHDRAIVYHNGIVVATFGIRRGSNANSGHGHIPNDLQINQHDTLRLANCPMSREEWIRRVVEPEENEEEIGQE